MKRREGGYSLLEMALVVVVMGIIAALAISLTPRLTGLFQQRSQAGVLAEMDRALLGFALTNSRLPCPDNNADGVEDCAGPAVGGIPYQTLGLGAMVRNPRGIALRYAVYRNANPLPAQDADLGVLKNRYTPLLPTGSIPAVNLNGLDFCVALRNASLAPGSNILAHIGAGARNIAYAIANPGARDADQVNGLFDGLNGAAGPGFAQPDQAHDAAYDDTVRAVGFNALAARLACPATLAEVSGLARAAFAAADLARLANFYKQFRDFAVRVRQTGVDIAREKRDLAIASEATAVATSASALALASQSPAIGGRVKFTAALAVIAATALLAKAIINLNTANDKLSTALNQQANANAALADADNFATLRLGALDIADGKGLLR